ncbi:MAG: DUF3306 domain-containing protein [Halomonas sp.]|uniref:DUF3306 domain-containing protein n=1 Tax=unclassified Halomonas TaxID=2609666 RepID=UPI003FB7E8ED
MSRLERWSRLKRNVAKAEDAPPGSLPARDPADERSEEPSKEPNSALHNQAERSQSVSELTEAPALESNHAPEPEPGSLDHTLPDPDTLEAGSDFSAFMAPGVSGPLRRQALKRLWATGNYNVRDGLDDYDADYNKLLKPMTAELAGKLRRWTNKVEEVVDKPLDDSQTEPYAQEDVAVNEEAGEAASEQEPLPKQQHVKKARLDDQSDVLSGVQTKDT